MALYLVLNDAATPGLYAGAVIDDDTYEGGAATLAANGVALVSYSPPMDPVIAAFFALAEPRGAGDLVALLIAAGLIGGGSGSGDVVGPAGATDNALARFNGATGKVIQNSGATLDDAGNLATPGTVNGRNLAADAAAAAATAAALTAHIGAGGAAHAAATPSVAGFMSAADKTAHDAVVADAVRDADFGADAWTGDLVRTGANLYGALRSNRSATTAPTVSDDASLGYAVGSRWIDVTHDRAWECLDATVGAAVWRELGVRGLPVVGPVVTGRYYAAGGIGISASTINLAGESGRMDLAPRVRRRTFGTLAGIGTQVQSGAAGANIRMVFYLPDANGWPGVRLWQSAIYPATAFGFIEETGGGLPNLDLYPLLWYGIAHEGATPGPQIRSHNQADTLEIGGWAPGATPAPNPGSVIRRTGVTLAALPDPFVFNALELTALVTPPLIYLRA